MTAIKIKIPQESCGNFDFLITCHKIKFEELECASILAIVHFISTGASVFSSIESFYLVAFGDITSCMETR